MMKHSFLIGHNNLKQLTFKGEVQLTTEQRAQSTEHRDKFHRVCKSDRTSFSNFRDKGIDFF
mgnify:CR=1 FL=1